jgi:glyoxalase family protein
MHGIHHVTAIAGNPQQNLDFYTRTLGMRFVKKTVNFDDPGTYHFYFGDEVGHPGTILTFFPWDHAAPGRAGIGLAQTTAFRVPAAAIGYWMHRFIERGVACEPPAEHFGEPVLGFADPDGLRLALVGVADAESEPAWSNGEVPAEHAVRGFHGVTLMLDRADPTGEILGGVLGFDEAGREGSFVRYRANAGIGGVVDLHEVGGFLAGRMGRGTVHHVAFRAADDAEQAQMARTLTDNGWAQVTEQKDRQYFRSVYFFEPGGVLFEIATDAPGFTVDEAQAELGRTLKLPPFLESRREELEAVLAPLETPA